MSIPVNNAAASLPRAAVIDYDAGNLRSVVRACNQVGLDAHIVADPELIRHAERIIFPGVGAAGAAMRSLQRTGMDDALIEAFRQGIPILGICLGLQISLDYSEENEQPTLGLLPGRVQRFRFDLPHLKVPHMGWNGVRQIRPHPLLDALEPADEFYFVHAYFPVPERSDDIFAITDYEGEFASAIGRDNYFAVQFHPEKSGRVGLRLLHSFAGWNGQC